MPPYSPKPPIQQAMSTEPAYMFGTNIHVDANGMITPEEELEHVVAGEKSRAIALAPVVETHGVRGFFAAVIWPEHTISGSIEIQGSDLNQEDAFFPLGEIIFPMKAYSSPAGQVINFMRAKVNIAPRPTSEVLARLTIR